MKIFLRKNKIILAVAAYIAAVCACVYFIFIPVVSGIWQLSQKIQENLADQKAENQRLGQIPQMEEDWKIFKNRESALNVTLKPENEIEFIENIEEIAIKSGCLITLDIGEQSDPKEIRKLKKQGGKKIETGAGIMDGISSDSFFPMQINLKGNYDGLAGFLRMLENSEIYVNIISMRIDVETVEKAGTPAGSPFSKEPVPKEKKETLNTTINAIVYTQ